MKKIFTLTIISLIVNINAWSQCIPNSSSLSFNGTSTEGSIPVNPLMIITDSITIEAWVNASVWTSNTTPTTNSIVDRHGWGSGEQGYTLRAGTTTAGGAQISFNFAGIDTMGNYTSWQEVLSTGVILSTNTWYHVAGTYDGDTLKCYVNGILAGTTPFKGSIRDSSAYDLKIGRLAFTTVGQTRYWNGKIDEVRLWHRALSPAELQANMNHHINPSGQTGLVGYWRCNEGVGTSFTDISGNNLNGSLTNGTWSTSVPFNTPAPAANINYSAGILSVSPAAAHYQWYFNSTPLPNDTLQSWHPTQSGQYYAIVTDSVGCTGISVALNITALGINELSASSAISVFSNPDNNLTTLQLSQGLIADRIEIYDASGRIIQVLKGKGSDTYSINCSRYSAGIYLMRINTNKGTFVNKLAIR